MIIFYFMVGGILITSALLGSALLVGKLVHYLMSNNKDTLALFIIIIYIGCLLGLLGYLVAVKGG